MKSRSLVLSSAFKGPLSNAVGQDANVVIVFDCSNVLISPHEQIIDEYGSCDKNKYEKVQEIQLGKKLNANLNWFNFPLYFFLRKHCTSLT